LVFLTVDGRQPELSVGITLKELAYFMKDYGIIKGMNLDGGASARMIVRGYTMSNPSSERLLSNGIIFYKIK
ncbi:MAG TPA: phosphodiester glycosidase family protein, partial [Halanaerobiales bacterium]|nr:phosphodiester glycosidase family protein [Halanaerobiales bacterium]